MEVSDESDTKKYEVSMADTDFIAKLKFYFGFVYREKASATFGKPFKNWWKATACHCNHNDTPKRDVGDFQREELFNATVLSKWQKEVM